MVRVFEKEALPVKSRGMEFPVDLLANVSQAEIEQSAHSYMNDLLFSNPDSPEHLTLSDSTEVTIAISTVGFVPLYGSSDKQRILALFSPSNPLTAVALYLLDQWWIVDDILKTADPARNGAVEVETLGERIVLYILNRVIYRAKEMSSDELPFLCHGENDHAKILWNNGEAVGFYSVKLPGSLCNSFSSRSYQLPVMDSIFVRKCHRGKGFGLQMLEDFVLSFKDDCLGLKYPLSTSMYKVCEKYLSQYPGDAEVLWEVERIGGPNQRTNIASKIQAMDLSAVSKSLSFRQVPTLITEVTENDVVMEAITSQIKEAESMECTVEIVEEVTVLRTTKEAELPVTAHGWSSGSKRRSTGEKITEDKSEKVLRIEDIEAEAPREEQVSAQQHNTHPDASEMVQTEGMFGVAPEEFEEDVADITPKEEAAFTSDKLATDLASHSREEADIISAPTAAEEPQEEDVSMQDLNNTCHDSQIRVENVASEIEEAKECHEEDNTVLIISENILEVHKETETVNKVGEETQLDVTAEKLEETAQQELRLLTHVPSEGGETKKGRNVVKALNTVVSETPRRRSQRHRKLEEEAKGETTAQHEGRVLRKRAIIITSTPKYKYPRHSHKKELVKEVGEVPEETTEEILELAVTKGEEPEEIPTIKEDAVAVAELREDKQQEDELEQSEKQQENMDQNQPEKEHMDEDDLGFGGLVSEEKTQEKGQVEVETDDKAEEETTKELTAVEAGTSEANEAAEDVPTLTELHMEEGREDQEDEMTEATSAMEADKEEETDGVIQEPDTVTADSKTDVLDEAVLSKAEEPQEKEISSEIPKLQEATVILVDLKTTHHLSVQEAGDAPADAMCAAPENEQAEPIVSAEEKYVSSCAAEEQSPEPEILVLGEEDGAVDQESTTEKSVDVAAETDEKEELGKENKESVVVAEEAPVIETRVLRSGRKVVKASYQQQEEDNTGEVITEKKEAETGTAEVEGEMEDMTEDVATVAAARALETSTYIYIKIPVVDDAEQNPSPADVDEEMSWEEEEAPVATRTLRSGRTTAAATQRRTRNRKLVDEQDAEEGEGEEEEPVVTTRMLRKRRACASVMPKGKIICKQIQVEEQKGAEESRSVEETGEEVEAGKGTAVEKIDTEETVEEELGEKENEEAVPKCIEISESEIEVEEMKVMEDEGQDEVVKQSEAITETLTERPKASGKDGDELNADMGGLEVEHPPFSVTMSLKSVGKTPKALPKTRSRRSKKQLKEEEEGTSVTKSADGDETTTETRILRKGRSSVCSKQVPKEEEGLNESADDAEVVVLQSNEEPPTERDEDETEKEEPVSGDVEKEISDEELQSVTAEKEETAGLTAVTDNFLEGETCTPLPVTNTATLTSSAEEATASRDEQQNEDIIAQLSDLQRVTVVLVDLKKTHQEVLEETAGIEEGLPAPEVGKEQMENMMSEEHALCSLAEIENTELTTFMEEEGDGDNVENTDTKKVTVEERAEEKVKEDEAKSVDDDDDDDAEEVNKTITHRSRRQAVRVMPRDTLAKSKQKKNEEQEKISEMREEKPSLQERVLRRGRKTVFGNQRTRRIQKTLQGKEEEVEGGEESTADDEKEAEEIVKQVEGQEQVEGLEEKDVTQQEKNVEAETGIEKGGVGAEEGVTLSEEGQAISTETAADEEVKASLGQSADEGKTSASAAEEVMATEDTAQGEHSPSTSEVALMIEKDDEMEEAPVIETRAQRSGEKTVRATPRSKATNEQEGDITEDEAVVEPRVLRRGRSATATPICRSKRACTHYETEEEGEYKTNITEEIQVEDTKEVMEEAEENKDGKIEEKNEETMMDKSSDTDEPAIEPRVLRRGRRSAPSTPRRKSKRVCTHRNTQEEAENVQVEETEAFEKEYRDENIHEKEGEETVAQKEENAEPEVEIKTADCSTATASTFFDTFANGQEEAPNTKEGSVTVEGEAPVVETRVLRSGGKEDPTKAMRRSNNTKSPEEENEQERTVVDKSSDADEAAVQTRALRKGRGSAAATPRHKPKRTRTQCETEEETEGEEEKAGRALPGVEREKPVEEEENMSMRMRNKGEIECTAARDAAVGDAEQVKDALTEEASVMEEEDSSVAAEDETGTDMTKAEETNSVDKTETTKVYTEVAKEEALLADESLLTEEEGRRQKEPDESLQQEEENLEDEETQEEHQLTDSSENRDLRTAVLEETDEKSPTGQEEQPSAERDAEDQAKIDDDVAELAGEELVGQQLEEGIRQEHLENNVGVVESTSEKGNHLNLVLDTDEEVETASQEAEEDSMSEEVEPVVIGKKILRRRTVPSLIITPQVKYKHHCSAEVQKAEQSLSDEEQSPQSAQRRSVHKRKSSEVTPTRKSKRCSRV